MARRRQARSTQRRRWIVQAGGQEGVEAGANVHEGPPASEMINCPERRSRSPIRRRASDQAVLADQALVEGQRQRTRRGTIIRRVPAGITPPPPPPPSPPPPPWIVVLPRSVGEGSIALAGNSAPGDQLEDHLRSDLRILPHGSRGRTCSRWQSRRGPRHIPHTARTGSKVAPVRRPG